MKYTEDEIEYAQERMAIMIHDAGLTEEEARAEIIKLIKKKRKEAD